MNYLIPRESASGRGNFVQDSGAVPIKIDLLFYPTSGSIKQIGKQGRPVATPRLEAVLKLSSTTCHLKRERSASLLRKLTVFKMAT